MENKNIIQLPLLNPFRFYQRFPHITEKIFQKLDNKSLTNCREVSKSWKEYIDNKNLSWIRIVHIPKILQNGEDYLHLAAKTGQSDMFDLILASESDKNKRNKFGHTPLLLICRNGHSKIVENLVNNYDELNIDFGIKTRFGVTAFHSACTNGHLEIVEIFMKNANKLNIDFNTKIDASGEAAFHLACGHNHFKIVEIFMKRSADLDINLNIKTRNLRNTGFHIACMRGSLETAELLIQKSIEFNIQLNAINEEGHTAFHLACISGQLKIVEMLIQKSIEFNIKLNTKDLSGNTAFYLPCLLGDLKIIELFIQNSNKFDLTAENAGPVERFISHRILNLPGSIGLYIKVTPNFEASIKTSGL